MRRGAAGIASGDPEQEQADLTAALVEARRELDDARELVGERFGPEFAAVFNPQIQIHEDKGFVNALEGAVQAQARAAGLEFIESIGLHYNPVTREYSLGGNLDVNYLMHYRRPDTEA